MNRERDFFFFFAKRRFYRQICRKEILPADKVLIKEYLPDTFRKTGDQFPVNKIDPDQNKYKSDFLNKGQVKCKCIANHDTIVQYHEGQAKQPWIEKTVKPGFIKAGESTDECNEPEKARWMDHRIM